MKILLISDTHGNIERAIEVAGKINGLNMIFHCGDLKEDADDLMRQLDIPVSSVPGNCDYPDSPSKAVVDTPAGRILLTHGHKENVDYNVTKLLYVAEENDCVAACFGHTHVAYMEDFDGITLINPGSLTRPRDNSGGTFAILDATADGLSCEIIKYEDFIKKPEPPRKKKVQGGYLRGLLNYSDRF